MAENRCIGQNGEIPWRLPADLKHFKLTTMDNPIIMGRRTFESIGEPLPGRLNIVITRNRDYNAPGCKVAQDIESAILEAAEYDEVFFIGGGDLYQQVISDADRIYMTEVHASPEGDTFFPELDSAAWRETSRESQPADEHNRHGMDFVIYERIRG